MTNTESALFTVRLAPGTKTVPFDDASRWIAEAKNPPPELLDEHGRELLGADWLREESMLEAAVRRSEVEVLDSSYHAMLPPFSSHKREKSILTVKAFRRYVESINGAVELADAPASNTGTPNPIIKKEGHVLKRSALVKKYVATWPDIDSDLNHASENGLSAAAKATKHGDWFESAVLAWGDQKGKRATQQTPVATNSVFNLSGKKYTSS